MDVTCARFKEASRKALEDGILQEALKEIHARLGSARTEAFAALDDAEGLRDRAYEIKKKTLDHLDGFLERLEENIRARGGRVHWASSGAAASEIIAGLAEERGVRTVVKGKSMVSEEIGLNEVLSSRGLVVAETDLGEYIIQLAGESPSHLVGPAIHKTKDQISRLFVEKLGADFMEDPGDLTGYAREKLRGRFLEADMGITGANFAVAGTGTVVLFENEGNIRLCTTLPRIHVAVMGIEKVIPDLDDLGVLIKLLARSATGQKLPCYVSMINGPARAGLEGPEEFHLVLLDNGRSDILGRPDLRETLHCIRCGACLNFCPVYLRTGGHAYGWVYSGPIGSILTPQLVDRKEASMLPYACTLCGACAEVCPVKVPIPRAMVALRRRYAEDPAWADQAPFVEKGLFAAYAGVLRHGSLYRGASRVARLARAVLGGAEKVKALPDRVRDAAPYTWIQALGKKTFRRQWREVSGGNKGE